MNDRDVEIQTLRLIELLKRLGNMPNTMLKKIDGRWYAVPTA